MDSVIDKDDVKLLSVNKNKIKNTPIGFELKKSNKAKILLETTSKNIANLAFIAAAAIVELPLVRSAVGAVGAMKANEILGNISKIVGQIKGMELTTIGGQIIQSELYNHMSLPTGNYSWVGYLVQFAISLAVNHPTIVAAGGVALSSLLTSKIIYPIIKKLVRVIKGTVNNKIDIKNANSAQKVIYDDIKKILNSKNLSKAKNYKNFVSTLKLISSTTSKAAKYEFDLLDLHSNLEFIYKEIEAGDIKDYWQHIINLQTIVKRIEYKSFSEFSDFDLSKKKMK